MPPVCCQLKLIIKRNTFYLSSYELCTAIEISIARYTQLMTIEIHRKVFYTMRSEL